MRTVTFDGHSLNDLVAVEDVRRPLWAGLRLETSAVSGRDGCAVRSATLDSMRVEVDVRSIKPSKAEMRDALGTLAGWLSVREPAEFTQSDRPGLRDLAIPTGCPSVSEWLGTGGATLVFLLPEPASRGARVEAGVGALSVGGTYRTAPRIACADATAGPSGLWGVRLDGGDWLHVPLGAGAHSVEIDCGARTCMVDGSNAAPTLDSDWWLMEPGEHSSERDLGGGTVVITWDERWL